MLNTRGDYNVQDRALVSLCRKLLELEWNVVIKHCYREANKSVKWLISNSLSYELRFDLLTHPLSDIA